MVATRKRAIPVLLFSLIGLIQGAHSRELFEEEKAPTFTRGQPIFATDQIGGYQIYRGNGTWQFEDAKVVTSGGNADTIPIGLIRMSLWDAGEIVATQFVAANLRANNGAYWSGSPCDGESLAKRNRGRGRYDDCMTIKAEASIVGGKQETFLVVNTVQSQTGGRYYIGTVGVNVSNLGFPGSSVLEWNKFTVQSDPAKAAAVAKLQSWAELYQDAVAAQMNYRRPDDSFASVPRLRELLVIPNGTPKPKVIPPKGASYVFCESSKTMVLEGSECKIQASAEPS
jgi:hypothetical protein